MKTKKIVILGGGIAGLSAAYYLQKKMTPCVVFEKELRVGGLCRSKNVRGFTFDYTGHVLHFKNALVREFVNDILGANVLSHNRSSWVYYQNRFIGYPFQSNLCGLPREIAAECLLDFMRARDVKTSKDQIDLEGWIKNNFGASIAKHFLLPYNSKFWAVPLNKIAASWAKDFIPIPSLEEIISGAFGFNKCEFGSNSKFWYPRKGGIGALPDALSTGLKNVYTNLAVKKIDLKRKEITLTTGDKERFDYLISTIPLPELPGMVTDLPDKIKLLFSKLRWNSVFNLNLGVKTIKIRKEHWIYFSQRDICFYRTGFYHNFSTHSVPRGKNSLYVEVSYSQNRKINKPSCIVAIKRDLKDIGIIDREDDVCAEDQNDIKYAYPIYDLSYYQTRPAIIKYFSDRDVFLCGRYGSWRYFSMEETIADGHRVASLLTDK